MIGKLVFHHRVLKKLGEGGSATFPTLWTMAFPYVSP